MALFPTKQQIETYAQEAMKSGANPEEQLVGIGFGQIEPSIWYGVIIGWLWTFLFKYFYIALTTHRLVVITVNNLVQPQSYTAYPLAQLKLIKYSKGILRNSITILFPNGQQEKFIFQKYSRGWEEISEKIASVIPK